MAEDNAFGYPMNLRAYATRGVIWAQRKVFKEWLKGRVVGRIPFRAGWHDHLPQSVVDYLSDSGDDDSI